MTCLHCGADHPPGARHCPECSRPLLTSLSSRSYLLRDADGREFPLSDGVSRIGRDPSSNEIVLTDASVSSRHAAIEVTPTSVVLRDLASTNGTYLNGGAVHRPVQLEAGERITFGNRELTFARHAPQSAAPRGIPIRATPPQPVVAQSAGSEGLATAFATIALTLLAILLNTVGIADGFQRDDLTVGLPLALVGLAALPLLAIVCIAAGRRWGYLLAALAALIGILFVIVAGPILAGSDVRDELTAEYGSTGYWFLAISAIIALVVEIIVLTVAFAGWKVTQPGSGQQAMHQT